MTGKLGSFTAHLIHTYERGTITRASRGQSATHTHTRTHTNTDKETQWEPCKRRQITLKSDMPTVDSRGSNAKGSLVAAAATAAEQPKGTRHSKRACHTHTMLLTHTKATQLKPRRGQRMAEKKTFYISVYIFKKEFILRTHTACHAAWQREAG